MNEKDAGIILATAYQEIRASYSASIALISMAEGPRAAGSKITSAGATGLCSGLNGIKNCRGDQIR
jgi:hypothetical protein